MKVLLAGAEVEENIATRYLAAALEREGHQAELVGFDRRDDCVRVVERARSFQPGVVGLSMTFQRRGHEFGTLANALRAGGYSGHLTCGGHFATFAWKEILERYPSIDSVVRHEGEATLAELCRVLSPVDSRSPAECAKHPARRPELSSIQGLVFRTAAGETRANEPRPLEPNLDALPFPKRTGEPPNHLGIRSAFLVGSRGCYGHCTFCSIHAFTAEAGGPKYRARSVTNLADEMAELYHGRKVRMFIFHDDDFFTRDRARDLARVLALRDELRQRHLDDIALVVKARPDDVAPDVFRVLREIGLLRVYVGVESGATQGLKTLGRGVELDVNRRALRQVAELGVYSCFNLLLFDPDSTLASLRESVGFLLENASVPMNFCRTEIYAGTPLQRRLAREGRLRGDVFGWDYDLVQPAAQRAFELFRDAFLDRNFRPDGLMNSNLSLGYHLHLLKHFYPLAFTPEIDGMARSVITRVNLDCVAQMERILEFAASPLSEHREARAEFSERTRHEVAAADAVLEAQVAEAIRAIAGAARTGRVRPSRWKQAVAAAAGLALGPLACSASNQAPLPPDPPPPPHTEPNDPRMMPPDPPPPPHTEPEVDGDESGPCGGGCPVEDPPPCPYRN